MTKIFVNNGQGPKEVESLTLHFSGDDGEYLWIEVVAVDGEKTSSFYMKGVL